MVSASTNGWIYFAMLGTHPPMQAFQTNRPLSCSGAPVRVDSFSSNHLVMPNRELLVANATRYSEYEFPDRVPVPAAVTCSYQSWCSTELRQAQPPAE